MYNALKCTKILRSRAVISNNADSQNVVSMHVIRDHHIGESIHHTVNSSTNGLRGQKNDDFYQWSSRLHL